MASRSRVGLQLRPQPLGASVGLPACNGLKVSGRIATGYLCLRPGQPSHSFHKHLTPIFRWPGGPFCSPKKQFGSSPGHMIRPVGAGRSGRKLHFRLFGCGAHRKTNKSNCISPKQSKVRSAQASSSPYRPEVALHPVSPRPATHLGSIELRPYHSSSCLEIVDPRALQKIIFLAL
jgi:hypothetical protein